MTNQTHMTFPTKKAAVEHQKRVSAMVHESEEEKHILASRYKTKMCKNFVARGECPYEVRCMFAHGDTELRTSEDNIRDGLITEEAIKAFQRQQNQIRRRAAYAAAREAEVRPAEATATASVSTMQHERPSEEEGAYYTRAAPQQFQSRDSLDAPYFIPNSQHVWHHARTFAHNPYAFDILPAAAREFAVYEEEPVEEAYWYEDPAAAAAAPAFEESYYFPSQEMMAPLVPSCVTQPHYHASYSDESADYSAYAAEKARAVAATMPSYAEEAPMVMEP